MGTPLEFRQALPMVSLQSIVTQEHRKVEAGNDGGRRPPMISKKCWKFPNTLPEQ